MGNRKKNKQRNRQNPNVNTNTNTQVLNTEAEKKETDAHTTTEGQIKKAEEEHKNEKTDETEIWEEAVQEENDIAVDSTVSQERAEEDSKTVVPEEILKEKILKKETLKKADQENHNKEDKNKAILDKKTVNIAKKELKNKEISNKEIINKESAKTDTTQKEDNSKESSRKQSTSQEPSKKETKGALDSSSEQPKELLMNAAKVLLPVAACVIVIAAVISFVSSRKSQTVVLNTDTSSDTPAVVTLGEEPLAENAHTDVNELMRTFYTALADGDMDTVKAIKDYNTDREIITYEKKSEFIESYDNVNCYTKPGIEDNSYFVYATYDVKIKDIATEAPGLNAFYVYTADDGSLKIDGDTEENIKAAFKLVTSQDDVVDLYNKIDVNYNEATASDKALDQFMTELPKVIKESVGVALAQLETQDENGEPAQAQESQPAETQTPAETEQPLQNQVVNQIVRTTDTVNVRSSDSEEADKIGKAQAGTELKRIEERINGWSKVIFEDKEAYIKSDYLEVVSTGEIIESAGTVTATTNVNVRSQASQESERLGSAPAGSTYNLVEDQGEWYKIDYNGTTGYVKAEFFTR